MRSATSRANTGSCRSRAGAEHERPERTTREQPVSSAAVTAQPAVPRLRSRRVAAALKGCAGVLLLLVAWQVSVPLVGLGPYFYPAPTDVIAAFGDLIRKGILPVYLADSVARYLAGLSVGALLGIAGGVLIGLNRR